MQRLLRNRPPTEVAHSGASSSGRVVTPCITRWTKRAGPGLPRRQILPPCRITSTAKELYASEEAKRQNMDDNGEDAYMDMPNYQLFDPDLGPFEKRIQRSYLEGVSDDKIDLRETEYWFSNPTNGWTNQPKRLFYMPEAETTFPQPWHDPDEGGNEGDERIAYSELEEGKVYLGLVTDVWLHHGVQIDIGAECDGLIPCTEEQWELAVDHIDLGEVVLVEVHKMRTPGLYRWPVQLKFTVKGLQDLMMHPDEFESGVDHSWCEANGLSPEQVAALVGRTLEEPAYFLPYDETVLADNIIDGYGTGDMYWRNEREAPVEDYIDDPLEDPDHAGWLRERVAEVDEAAGSLLGR